MTVKMVELDTWLEEWDQGGVVEGFTSRDAQRTRAESSHLMERLLAGLTDPDALVPLEENLALWTTACDHLQDCAICRSGLAALAAVGDTPEGALGALLAHAAQEAARGSAKQRRAGKPRARKKGNAPGATPAPDASALASYVAIVQTNGVAAATQQLPDVARHLRGCPRCRRDVADALAALQTLEERDTRQ